MERVVIDVANGLDSARFHQTICCISRKGEAAQLLSEHVRLIDLGKGNQADRLMPLKIARIIRREKPDIVHSQSWSGIDTAIARLIGGRVHLVHSEHGRNFPHLESEPTTRRIARRALYHFADKVFAVSNEVRDHYCRQTGYSPERMSVIPNGIDVSRIDEADGGGAREEFGIAGDDFVIGTVARLDATKDTITLARAFAKLHQSHHNPKFKLLIVGDGSERAKLEAFAADQGLTTSVIFAGLRQDVPRLLKAMNVFALSSLSEGMPITVLEAMAAGLPVVATKVGALPDLAEEGLTGFLVEPEQPEAIAERLAELLANPELAKSFGAEARRKVEREFGIDLMLRRYAELYTSVLQS